MTNSAVGYRMCFLDKIDNSTNIDAFAVQHSADVMFAVVMSCILQCNIVVWFVVV